VRSKDYHYILYSDGSEELYDHSINPVSDLAVDPNEWTNQADNAAYAAEKAVLKRRLFESLGLVDPNSLVANGSFESNLDNWVAMGSASAVLDSTNVLAGAGSALVTGGGGSSVRVLDYQFNDASGTSLNSAVNAGSDSGTWNFGGFQTQTPNSTGIGALNVGYTEYYKSQDVDASAGSTEYRKHTLSSAMTTGQFEFIVDFASWNLRRDWDSSSDSAQGKGVQFSLLGSSTVSVRFETYGAAGFRASASGYKKPLGT
jgi:hypothetical protein